MGVRIVRLGSPCQPDRGLRIDALWQRPRVGVQVPLVSAFTALRRSQVDAVQVAATASLARDHGDARRGFESVGALKSAPGPRENRTSTDSLRNVAQAGVDLPICRRPAA